MLDVPVLFDVFQAELLRPQPRALRGLAVLPTVEQATPVLDPGLAVGDHLRKHDRDEVPATPWEPLGEHVSGLLQMALLGMRGSAQLLYQPSALSLGHQLRCSRLRGGAFQPNFDGPSAISATGVEEHVEPLSGIEQRRQMPGQPPLNVSELPAQLIPQAVVDQVEELAAGCHVPVQPNRNRVPVRRVVGVALRAERSALLKRLAQRAEIVELQPRKRRRDLVHRLAIPVRSHDTRAQSIQKGILFAERNPASL